MLLFRFEWCDEPEASGRSGYELGRITLTREKGVCTSRGKSPDQAMMVAIAINEILYGLGVFLKGKQPTYRFVGVDSSFSIYFRKGKKGRIAIRCGAAEIGEVDAAELCEAVLSGVESFYSHSGNMIPEGDPVCGDFVISIRKFKLFVEEMRRSGRWGK